MTVEHGEWINYFVYYLSNQFYTVKIQLKNYWVNTSLGLTTSNALNIQNGCHAAQKWLTGSGICRVVYSKVIGCSCQLLLLVATS